MLPRQGKVCLELTSYVNEIKLINLIYINLLKKDKHSLKNVTFFYVNALIL